MKLLLSISVLLAAVIVTHASVYNDFTDCLKYFYKKQIPKGFQGVAKPDLFDRKNFPDGINVNELASPAHICQRYENAFRFATLYDRGRRIALYSAYIMGKKSESATNPCKRPRNFKSEPQLVYREVNGDMITAVKKVLKNYNQEKKINERKEQNRPTYLVETSQAVDEEYSNEVYDKGHLNPCGHHSAGQDEYEPTFTLTNTVPMVHTLNNGIWSQYEIQMIEMSKECKEMYVITGIVPGNVAISKLGLTAPTYVWNAYCCLDNNDKPIMSGAALAENIEKSNIEKFQKIDDLEAKLKKLLGVENDIELFEGGCSV